MLVVSGSQHALHLCSQVLLDVGDVAAMEDPGYPLARAAFLGVGARVAPVGIDQEGLVVSTLIKRRLRPRLVYVTPSHQCPLGMAMSLSRRLQLIDFAHRMNAWILEDDYLSEYRYFSRPLPALQSLDANGRVIYIGTVSKTLIPALRIGYVILSRPTSRCICQSPCGDGQATSRCRPSRPGRVHLGRLARATYPPNTSTLHGAPTVLDRRHSRGDAGPFERFASWCRSVSGRTP